MVAVEIGEFAVEALAGGTGRRADAWSARISRALGVYLADRGSGRPGWAYPDFLRQAGTGARARLELEVDDELWGRFAAEASRQGVSVDRLTEHAALYLAAEMSSGRIAESDLDDAR